jgi:hypothetical protein
LASVAFESLFVEVKHESFPRCPHSVWMAGVNHGSTRAPYCSICSPTGPKFNTRPVILPRSCGDGLEAPTERAHNLSDRSHYCSKCESAVYIETKDRRRECADCGHIYSGPRKRVNHQ